MLISKLRDALIDELESRKPYLSLRIPGVLWRQGAVLAKPRYSIYVLEDHILERTCSVIFTAEVTENHCVLRFCRPLTQKEHEQLTDSRYVPMFRSKTHLTVGLGESGEVPYAYSSVKLLPHGSAVDLLDAMFVLGKELEAFLNYQ